MSSDPSHVSCAPVDLARVVVENELEGCSGVQHVTRHRVEHTLGLPSGATVIKILKSYDVFLEFHQKSTVFIEMN